MNLPLTISYANRTINGDGSVTLVAVLKDNTNVVLSNTPGNFRATDPASLVIGWLQGIVRAYIENNLTATDIPVNLSFQFGLPATVRPIDLIL